MIKDYYTLTKPGILYGNALTLVAGFMLASYGASVDYWLLVATLIGLSLVIASGCVFNNYIDRDIDAVMERTKKRALVRGIISLRRARIYGTILGILGFVILAYFTNMITLGVSFVGFFVYVIIYSMWLKRMSVHSALVGSISGAVPIVTGYLAVTGDIDVAVIILFFILVFWQMPHSYAIALYRLRDYKAASIPVLPVRNGVHQTKVQIVIYSILFMVATFLLYITGYMGIMYASVMLFMSSIWVSLCIYGFFVDTEKTIDWARKVFIFSIVIILVFCCMVVLGK